MRRGTRVGVDGRLSWREWETDDEQKRQAISIVADSVQFLDSAGPRAEGEEAEELVGAGVGGDADGLAI
jgi:single-strand DNA-binding protein